jgi:hypothetical protein
MTIPGRAGIVRLATSALFILLPLAVSAQTADFAQTADSAQTPRSTGPMTVERVKSGFLIAPDFKVTRFDGKTSPLAGVYGGWLNDQTLFFGAGAYWNTDRSRTHDLTYVGFVAGWYSHLDHPVGFGVKGLIGGGEADLAEQVAILQRAPIRGQPPTFGTATVRFRRDFFIAEPEADVLVHLSRLLTLTGGAGYRFTSGERGTPSNRLRGATGSVALQIGGGY